MAEAESSIAGTVGTSGGEIAAGSPLLLRQAAPCLLAVQEKDLMVCITDQCTLAEVHTFVTCKRGGPGIPRSFVLIRAT